MFRARGHAASTREVATAVGLSQGVLFQRFGTKDELFFRAMTPQPADLTELLGAYPPADGFEDLRAISGRLLAYVRHFTPTLLQVLAYSDGDEGRLRAWHARVPFPAIARALADRLRRLDRDGLVTCADPQAAAIVVIASVHLLALLDVMASEGDRDTHGARLDPMLHVLWRGLEPREDHPSRRRTGKAAAAAPRRRR